MIVPIITSMSEDAMASVPNKMREVFGLGSTKFEVATKVVLPAAASGVIQLYLVFLVLLVKQRSYH